MTNPTTTPQQGSTMGDKVEELLPIYVASRASIPERSAMWRHCRDFGLFNIVSTWIDEAGEGETECNTELWRRIETEVRSAKGLILYAEEGDFPLKGALVEVGMALGMGKPVRVVCAVSLHPHTMRPLGSWAKHPLVGFDDTVEQAAEAITAWNTRSSPIGNELVDHVREAMSDAWGEICDDTGCHPLDIRREGRKTFFEPRHWADLTALRLSERLSSLTEPVCSEGLVEALEFIADLPDPGEKEERSATFYRVHAAMLKQVAAKALGRETVSPEAFAWAEQWINSDEGRAALAALVSPITSDISRG